MIIYFNAVNARLQKLVDQLSANGILVPLFLLTNLEELQSTPRPWLTSAPSAPEPFDD